MYVHNSKLFVFLLVFFLNYIGNHKTVITSLAHVKCLAMTKKMQEHTEAYIHVHVHVHLGLILTHA